MNDWLELLPALSLDQRAKAHQAGDPSAYLLAAGLAQPDQILDACSRHFRVPSLRLNHYNPDPAALRILSEEQARDLKILPLFMIKDHAYVAIADPHDLGVLDFVARLTGSAVEPVVALGQEIEQAVTRWMLSGERSTQIVASIAASRPQEEQETRVDENLEDREAPTIRLVDHIFAQAVRLGVSDIHLEPFPDSVILRYRVDGHLREYPAPPKSMYAAVVSRIKITSGLDIAERRLPQDGRSSIVVDGKKYDLRVSVIPNLHGEGIVVRILSPYAIGLTLGGLGFEPDMQARYEELLRRPYGIILVTGPTGSGKSTTLYATLNHIKDVGRKIITLEDPVEYQLAGITQIQVQQEIGYTFAAGLKAILRHDPDTVLVGEIRDLESAQIAIRAALTGHQMFSTLHTNTAAQAITRLSDMGIPHYLIMASLNGVIAQRLLRRLCPACKQPQGTDPVRLKVVGLSADEAEGRLFGPQGCSECHYVGYRGRVAIYELLEMTPSLRRLTSEQAQPQSLVESAEKEGAFFSLQRSARIKILQGMTSVDEATSLAVGE